MNTFSILECGYSLTWDNVQKLVQTRDSCRDSQNHMYLWANAFATKNRIVADDVDDISLCLQAKEIPLAKYFPSAEDTNMLRIRMKTLISRILVEHLPHFKQHYGDTISWHIDHPHQHAASQKSEIVSSFMPKYSKI